MAISRVFFRFFATLVIAAFVIAVDDLPTDARARIIAVVLFRSTAHDRAAAAAASKALAERLAQEPGWDAVTVDVHGRSPADAAAAVGAELYVIGQYFPGTPAHVAGATYRVATDERLTDFNFDVTGMYQLSSSINFATVSGTSDANPLSAPQQISSAATPQQEASGKSIVPRGTVIVVSLDHLLNSYSASSREPLSYTVVQDVIINGHLVARAGDQASGIVLEAQQGNMGGPYGIGWKAANLRVDVEAVHNFCGDTIPMSFIRSEYRRRQGIFGAHQDLEIIKGQKYLASVASTVKVCSEETSSSEQPLPTDALPPDDASSNISAAASPPATSRDVNSERISPSVSSTISPTLTTVLSRGQRLITPPSNWTQKPWNSNNSDFSSLGYWMSASQGESLAVIMQPIPHGMTPAEFVQLTEQSLQRAVGPNNIRFFKSDRICNGTADGWYIESSVTVGPTPMIAEQTIGAAGGQAYIATYRRPSNQTESPSARQSLYSLCPTPA